MLSPKVHQVVYLDRRSFEGTAYEPARCATIPPTAPSGTLVGYNIGVRTSRSAHKHGVSDDDIDHALDHSVREIDLDQGRWLVLGPDRAANIIELIVLIDDEEDEAIVINAMPITD